MYLDHPLGTPRSPPHWMRGAWGRPENFSLQQTLFPSPFAGLRNARWLGLELQVPFHRPFPVLAPLGALRPRIPAVDGETNGAAKLQCVGLTVCAKARTVRGISPWATHGAVFRRLTWLVQVLENSMRDMGLAREVRDHV